MKPIGWRKMYQECNSADKMPKKSVKTFKRGANQKVKEELTTYIDEVHQRKRISNGKSRSKRAK
jgi:hypothetical protein